MTKILLVRTSSMGDLIHTFPAISDLSRNKPDINLYWLSEEAFVPIASLHPFVKDIIPLAWRRWRKQIFTASTWQEIKRVAQQLKQEKFDLVIDSQGLLKSAIPARWCHAPISGYDHNSIRESFASRFYHQKYTVSRQLSAIERNRQLFALTFHYTYDHQKVDFGIQSSTMPEWIPKREYVVLLHATSRTSKEWPEDYWVELGNWIFEEYGLISLLPWGNPVEYHRAKHLVASISHAHICPKFELTDAAGLLGHARAIIGVDTGLLHLANALNKPLVGIYRGSDPELTGIVPTNCAVNIGGIDQMPSVDIVTTQLSQII